ncbi:hypothetical protein GOBAR_DD19975 [Gossypium barbadense]|nr:hypothetical protein GOBAR_DD19975 [Gossypium barbadense]
MEGNGSRADAKLLLGIAKKLLQGRHFKASRDVAVLAQQTDPLLEGPDQILAVIDVVVADVKRINDQHDWYSILQIDCRSQDNDLIEKQYHRLTLLLDPEQNKFPFADDAFKLVSDAWSILSNSSKKSVYDKEFDSCTRIDLSTAGDRSYHVGESTVRGEAQNQERMQNLELRKENQRPRMSTFWTACPYCYMLFEYPRIYEGCCLRCQNCDRAFHGVLIQTLPPLIPEKEAYYCTWAFFPLLSGGQETEVEPPPGFPDKRRGSERNDGRESEVKAPPGFPEKRRGAQRNGGTMALPPPASAPTTTMKKATESIDNVAGISGGNVQPNHNAGVLAVETADFDEGGRKDNAEAATPMYMGEIL